MAAAGVGFFFGVKQFDLAQNFQKGFYASISKPIESIIGGISTEIVNNEQEQISLQAPLGTNIEQKSPEKLTQPVIEIETTSPDPAQTVTQKPTVVKLLTPAEIETQIANISKQVEILKVEFAKYQAEKQLEQLKFAEIQKQINDIQTKINSLSQQVKDYKQSNSLVGTVAVSQETDLQITVNYNEINFLRT